MYQGFLNPFSNNCLTVAFELFCLLYMQLFHIVLTILRTVRACVRMSERLCVITSRSWAALKAKIFTLSRKGRRIFQYFP